MSTHADSWNWLTIIALAVVTVVTRSFFFISSKPWRLPDWAQRGMAYAPIAALSAIILPEIIMTQGQLISTWQDARIFAALAGTAWFFARRGSSQVVLGTIVVGMLVYLPLRLGLGW